jgi:COP9 signalosome complex subunit 1
MASTATPTPDNAPSISSLAEPSTLDLETYIANYQGVTRIKRLAFIATSSPNHKADALRMAMSEVKRSTNTALFLELVALSGDDGIVQRDDAWVEQVDRKAAQRLDKLENDLNQHKTTLVKESIRVCPHTLSRPPASSVAAQAVMLKLARVHAACADGAQ